MSIELWLNNWESPSFEKTKDLSKIDTTLVEQSYVKIQSIREMELVDNEDNHVAIPDNLKDFFHEDENVKIEDNNKEWLIVSYKSDFYNLIWIDKDVNNIEYSEIKFFKWFIDWLSWSLEDAEELIDNWVDSLVEKIKNLNTPEKIWDFIVDLWEDVVESIKQIWEPYETWVIIWWMWTWLLKWTKVLRKLEKVDWEENWKHEKNKEIEYNSLYDNPDYKFLWEYKEFLWKIDKNDILWEWDNAIVLNHPNKPDKVVKIAKERKVDDLFEEFKSHEKFYNKIKEWHIEWKVPENIQIWKIEKIIEDKKWIYIIDKIEWQSVYTWHYKERYEKKLMEYSKNTWLDIDKLTDSQFIDLLDELKLSRVYWYDASLDVFERNNQKQLSTFHRWIIWREDIQKWLNYLKENWLEHTDLHSKNIMIKFEWGKPVFYIIDFGRTNIK